MAQTLLLTSFQTWKAKQSSNASDDLLQHILADPSWAQFFSSRSLAVQTLRRIPVDFQHAPAQVIAQIQHVRPDFILLCGMAASRKLLNLEQRAIAGDKVRATSLNLRHIRQGLPYTRVSYNAGRFVCNGLYYAVLSYLQAQQMSIPCLFIHVPILTPANTSSILQDFQSVCDRIVADRPETQACLSLPSHATISV